MSESAAGQLIIVSTTCDDRAVLENIAAELVRANLAACCQISGPITSHYRWQGTLETTTEWVCAAKTTRDLYEQVRLKIQGLHSYELPEIVAVEIRHVSQGYWEWMNGQLRGED